MNYSRYVLWNEVSPIAGLDRNAAASPVIESALKYLSGGLESVAPHSLDFRTKIAIRELLINYDLGREILFNGSMSLSDATTDTVPPYDIPLDRMDFSVRAYRCLKSASVKSLVDLLRLTPAGLKGLKNFGSTSFNEVTEYLRSLGFTASGADQPFWPGYRDGDDGPLGTIRSVPAATIEEMQLSVRSYNCLKHTSVKTLHDLLRMTPAGLLGLTNFGRTCLDEITGLLKDLGYSSPGEDSPFYNGSFPDSEGGQEYSIAFLETVESLFSEKDLHCKLQSSCWYTLADMAVHSVPAISQIAKLNAEQRCTLENTLSMFGIALPTALPDWPIMHVPALQRVLSEEPEEAGFLLNPVESAISETPIADVKAKSLNELIQGLIPRRYPEKYRAIVNAIFGLSGSEPMTLEAVAELQSPPLTRERGRQNGRGTQRIQQASAQAINFDWYLSPAN